MLNISCHLVTIPLHTDRNEMAWEENYVTGTLHIYHQQWQHRLGKHLSPLNTVSRLEKQHRACYYIFLQSQHTTLTKTTVFPPPHVTADSSEHKLCFEWVSCCCVLQLLPPQPSQLLHQRRVFVCARACGVCVEGWFCAEFPGGKP